MDAVHVRLARNHVPVVGLGLSFQLLLAAAFMKSDDAKRLALVGLFRLSRARAPGWLVMAVLVLSFAESGLLAWTAYVGGQIRHSEIRPRSPVPGAPPVATPCGPLPTWACR